jgi:hypothetical protein
MREFKTTDFGLQEEKALKKKRYDDAKNKLKEPHNL